MRVTGITFLLDHNNSSKITKYDKDLFEPLTSLNQSVGVSTLKIKEFLSDKASNSIEIWIEPDSS